MTESKEDHAESGESLLELVEIELHLLLERVGEELKPATERDCENAMGCRDGTEEESQLKTVKDKFIGSDTSDGESKGVKRKSVDIECGERKFKSGETVKPILLSECGVEAEVRDKLITDADRTGLKQKSDDDDYDEHGERKFKSVENFKPSLLSDCGVGSEVNDELKSVVERENEDNASHEGRTGVKRKGNQRDIGESTEVLSKSGETNNPASPSPHTSQGPKDSEGPSNEENASHEGGRGVKRKGDERDISESIEVLSKSGKNINPASPSPHTSQGPKDSEGPCRLPKSNPLLVPQRTRLPEGVERGIVGAWISQNLSSLLHEVLAPTSSASNPASISTGDPSSAPRCDTEVSGPSLKVPAHHADPEQSSADPQEGTATALTRDSIILASSLLDYTWQKLNTGHWRDVPLSWRLVFTWGSIALVGLMLHQLRATLQRWPNDLPAPNQLSQVMAVVRACDRGLLMGGDLDRNPLHSTAASLNSFARLAGKQESTENDEVPRICPEGLARVTQPLLTEHCPALTRFLLQYMEKKVPVVLTGIVDHWPALNCWSFGYLRKVAGARTVPVEVGARYTDQSWYQRLMTLDEYITTYVTGQGQTKKETPKEKENRPTEETIENRTEQSLTRENTKDEKQTSENTMEQISTDTISNNERECSEEEGQVKEEFNQEETIHIAPHTIPHQSGPQTQLGKEEVSQGERSNTASNTALPKSNPQANTAEERDETEDEGPGYLAQHQLLDQVPQLRDDILVPDYCHLGEEPPRLHAWIGPCGTVSPLHHDPDHNILVQVVGYKYIRLYEEDQTPLLYPHPDPLLSNTSQVDVEAPEAEETWLLLRKAHYHDLILEPGQALYIPPRCWHYVRSLSTSMSVSFWWT